MNNKMNSKFQKWQLNIGNAVVDIRVKGLLMVSGRTQTSVKTGALSLAATH